MASSLLPLALVSLLLTTINAQVPKSDTFKFVNEGEFGPFITEYDASYRITPLAGAPFQLMWYNTTPGEFYVGLRMGLRRSESLFRWVWDANRGKPVKENATLTFSTNGNLVLAEADGTVVWSTNTANKGVVGIKILPVGNIVLFDKSGKFVWQSFDHPTDTLMVSQSLYVGGPTKIVSRMSATDNFNGIYSFELEPKGLNLYRDKLLYSSDRYTASGTPITNIKFEANPSLVFRTNTGVTFNVVNPNLNTTFSILRLQADGNLEVYTYNDQADTQAWTKTYAFFSDISTGVLPACGLPSKCGSLGVCEDGMCVSCPTPKGLLGWSKTCAPPALAGMCRFGRPTSYYKVAGVEQFIPNFNKGVGKVSVDGCKKRCDADCTCLGFFYREKEGTCWLAHVLGSLSRVSDMSRVVYIKKYV